MDFIDLLTAIVNLAAAVVLYQTAKRQRRKR